jgi:hypothetical protein
VTRLGNDLLLVLAVHYHDVFIGRRGCFKVTDLGFCGFLLVFLLVFVVLFCRCVIMGVWVFFLRRYKYEQLQKSVVMIGYA